MSTPYSETADDGVTECDGEEQHADEAESEPEVEHDVVRVHRGLELSESGLVVLEIHPKAIADEEVMRNQLLRLRGEVESVLRRLRLTHAVKQVLIGRGEWDLDCLPVRRRGHDDNEDPDSDDCERNQHHLA